METAFLQLPCMPKRCADCPLRCSFEGNEPFCYITLETVNNDEYYKNKPNWCPLKSKETLYANLKYKKQGM